MSANHDPSGWLRGLAEVAGESPAEPHRYARQLEQIRAGLRRRRARDTAMFVAGGVLAAAAAVTLLFWGRLAARTGVDAEPYYEAPATKLETARGWAHEAEAAPARASLRHVGKTDPVADREEPSATAPVVIPREPQAIAADPAPASDSASGSAFDSAPASASASAPAPAPAPVDASVNAKARRAPAVAEEEPASAPALTADILLKRANEARARRRVDEARAALLDLRRRFPEDPAAEHASFLLGRVESELAGDATAAITWFSRYLQEYPDGRFALGARGRRLRSLAQRQTDPARVEEAARDYLAHHPNGPYAELARRVLAPVE